jgi:hypothetical protein
MTGMIAAHAMHTRRHLIHHPAFADPHLPTMMGLDTPVLPGSVPTAAVVARTGTSTGGTGGSPGQPAATLVNASDAPSTTTRELLAAWRHVQLLTSSLRLACSVFLRFSLVALSLIGPPSLKCDEST